MKKIFNLLLALPLLMLAACAEDKALAPAEEHTYTFNAQVATMDSRLDYEEEGGKMKCHWELGDTVTVKDNAGTETYKFAVTKVNADGTAVLSYTGYILNANAFSGTATYAPRDVAKVNLQKANNNTEHLKYGETMVATITNQKLEGSTLVFSHPSTAVYKVKFKVPVEMTNGGTMYLRGAWTQEATVTLDFTASKNDVVTAYMIHTGGTIAVGNPIKILVKINNKIYGYTHYSSKDLTYETGKYWVADIANKKMVIEAELPVPTPIDLDLPSGLKWANFDLGAAGEGEIGGYYGWGCVEPYDTSTGSVTWTDYFHKLGLTGSSYSLGTCGSADDPLRSYVLNMTNISNTEWDAAKVKLGGGWRMPTESEIDELLTAANCTWTVTKVNDRDVYKVTSNTKGTYIYLPFDGYIDDWALYPDTYGFYWCGTPKGSALEKANAIYLDKDARSHLKWPYERYVGLLIRPVYDPGSSPMADPEPVDLGLSVEWADINIGAGSPDEAGFYYGWGCTKPYDLIDDVVWKTYFKYLDPTCSATSINDAGTSKDPLRDYVYPNYKNLDGNWDIARVKLGGDWRMPTLQEQQELIDESKCTLEWLQVNGTWGLKVTSKVPGYEGNSIFLPDGGMRTGTTIGSNTIYWSSTPINQATLYATRAHGIFISENQRGFYDNYRSEGHLIRAVREKKSAQPVDLGLSVKWATYNLGASAPEEVGNYYGWGCTEPYTSTENVNWPLYFSKLNGTGTGNGDCGTSKDPLQSFVTDKISIAGTQWDAARKELGGTWRLPTNAEILELSTNCDWEWQTNYNGVAGFKVMKPSDHNVFIFLPATGYREYEEVKSPSNGDCWSSTPYNGNKERGHSLYYYDNAHGSNQIGYLRYYGFTIRPVCD